MHEATAVYVFSPDFEKLLFIRHRKGVLKGRWLPPGGHVDPGETPEEAAVREVKEETGQDAVLLDLTPHLARTLSPRTRRIAAPMLVQVEDLGDHRHLDFVYVAVAPRPAPLVEEADQPAAWFTPEEAAAERVLEDCRGHAAYLFAERERFRALYEAQSSR